MIRCFMQFFPKTNRKKFFLAFLLGALFYVALFSQSFAESLPSCRTFSSRDAFFANFEHAEYINGLLRLHFKTNITSGATWQLEIHSFSDECFLGTAQVYQTFSGLVYLTPGVENFSIRFTSPTHFEVWNDDGNVPETCAACSGTIPAFPGYYQIAVQGIAFRNEGHFFSTSFHIQESPASPPIKTETLPAPEGCQELQTTGLFFDAYERVEYINGLLRFNFRLKTPYNSANHWRSTMRFHNEECIPISETNPDSFNGGAEIYPYSRYFSVRFSSTTHFDIWNDETNSIETCRDCAIDIPGTFPDGSPISFVSFGGSVSGSASLLSSTPFPVREEDYYGEQKLDPVIIIPGILGSVPKNDIWYMDPILHTYDDLIHTLIANGYTKDVNLFPMPYDWRRSNVDTAIQLEEKIAEIKEICECQKVDIVAHSMGGLIARQYIQSNRYNNDIDQLIFLGTPHLGAPKAYLMWEGGEIGSGLSDKILEIIFSLQAEKLGFDNLFDYVRNYPISSAQELLPIYSYIFENNNLRSYPFGYPINNFLENLKSSVDVLLNSGVRISNIIGDTQEQGTRISFDVEESDELPLWEYGKPININLGFGDGTVPFPSANFINKDLVVTNFPHRYLPTGVQETIFKKLTGENPFIVFKDNYPYFPEQNPKFLVVRAFSPIDIIIMAPDGKRIGKNFETGEEFNEIEDAFYSGFLTDNEFITIPNPLDGDYVITTQGTDDGGEYTVAIGYISEEEINEIEFNGAAAPDAFKDIIVSVNNDTPGESVGFEITLDGIIKDIEMVSDAGWITKKNVTENLIRKIQRVVRLEKRIDWLEEKLPGKPKSIKRIEKIEKRIDKILAKAFIKELEKQKKKGTINESAYILLKEDIEWLLNNN